MTERPADEGRRLAIRQALVAALFGGSMSLVSLAESGPNPGDFIRRRPGSTQLIQPTFNYQVDASVPFDFQEYDNSTSASIRPLVQFRSPDSKKRIFFFPNSTQMSIVDVSQGIGASATLMAIGIGDDGAGGFLAAGDVILVQVQGAIADMIFNSSQTFNTIIYGNTQAQITAAGDTMTLSRVRNTPAQVGQPTGTIGSDGNFATDNHRHSFSGRFSISAFNPLGVGAGLPLNFHRIKIGNAWTLRRIWVYAQAGPTGGTETYAVVNAAGAVQGTAVVLPAGPGATQAESALQVTNLTGGTLYYLAQTAIGAGWAAGAANVMVGIEYTMNI